MDHPLPPYPTAPQSALHSRNVRFALTGIDLGAWHASGRAASHFFNAMSLFFPKGEKFFIASVRHYQSQITDPALRAAISGFSIQEATHSREHRAYIDALERAGYACKHLDVSLFSRPLASIAPASRLASTLAMEHFTATIAHLTLADCDVMRGDPEMCLLWKWHAIEEIEHRSVAHDVFATVYGNGLSAYLLRTSGALVATWNFLTRLFRHYYRLAAQDKQLGKWSATWGLMRFLWLSPGLFRKSTPSFLRYFAPGFRPSADPRADLIASIDALLQIRIDASPARASRHMMPPSPQQAELQAVQPSI